MARIGRARPAKPFWQRFRVLTSAVTVALTGVVGTGSVDTVVPSITVAITGVSATGAVGTVAPSSSIALTGETATGAVGTVEITAALTGVEATGAVGTVAPSTAVALTGAAATGAVGTVTVETDVSFPEWEQRAKNVEWRKKTRWVEQGFLSVPIEISLPSPGGGSIFNVRVEANDINSATLRWDYTGTSDVKVYRSTDNITYSLVSTTVSTYPTTEYEYEDDGTLAERTLYYYKLTDNSGLTYTAPVHVVSYLIAMGRGKATSAMINVVPAQPGQLIADDFNILIEKINSDNQASRDQESVPCEVCSSNGSLVINCTSSCEWFRVVLTEDINSISLVGCDGCPPIDFVLPPNTTRRLCGWPVGCNYLGDECFEAPIPGGPNGRVAKTTGQTYDGYWNANKPGTWTSTCACQQGQQTLIIKNCEGTLTCS